MIGFIDRYEGGAINIDAIERLGARVEVQGRYGKERRFPVWFKGAKDVSRIELHECDVKRMLERPIQLLPAEVGARLLSVGVDEGDAFYCHATALIAWALCADGFTRPVTPAGVDDSGSEPEEGWWVELPSGGIYEISVDAAVVEDRSDLERLMRARKQSDDDFAADRLFGAGGAEQGAAA